MLPVNDRHDTVFASFTTTTTEAKTSSKKRIHTFSKFIADIPCRSIFPILINFSGVEFYRNVSKFKRRIRKPLSCVTSSTKLENRQFHVVVVYRWQRNVTKKLNAECAKLLFCLSKHITIFSYVLVVFAKLPN